MTDIHLHDPRKEHAMSRADELKIMTDSVERLTLMGPPLHLPYSSQPDWYYGHRRIINALQAEITKLLSTQPEPIAAAESVHQSSGISG